MAGKTIELSGGDGMQRALADIADKLGAGAAVNVGFLKGATYPPNAKQPGLQVAQVAFWNEFGTSRAPPRPFFRNMIAKNSAAWPDAVAGLLKANKYDAPKSLALIGKGIEGQLSQSIIATNSPPLAAATVRMRAGRYKSKRNSDSKTLRKPLIDTGWMIASIDSEVVQP